MDTILIVEDDRDIATLVEIHLNDMGFKTEKCHDGLEALNKVLNETYALVVLDIMLPSIDGLEICKRMRMDKINTPVLMLTAKSEELDKVLGLEIGADDYLTKPFSVREMTARVKAILRRATATKDEASDDSKMIISSEDVYIDIDKRVVRIRDEKKDLSPKEFDLLVLLASNDGRTFTRQQLLSQVWGYDFDGFEHTVNSHINRLRAKVEHNVQSPEFILTTWGVGYRFKDFSEA